MLLPPPRIVAVFNPLSVSDWMVGALNWWIVEPGVFLVEGVWELMRSSSPNVFAQPWWLAQYDAASLFGSVLAVLLLIAAVGYGVVKDRTALARGPAMAVAVGAVGIPLAPWAAEQYALVVDYHAAQMLDLGSGQATAALDRIVEFLNLVTAGLPGGIPSGLVFFPALLMLLGAFLTWAVLGMADVFASVGTIFFAVCVVGLIFTPTAKVARRSAEVVLAALSMPWIVATIQAAGWGALASTGTSAMETLGLLVMGSLLMLGTGALAVSLVAAAPFADAAVARSMTPGAAKGALPGADGGGRVASQAMTMAATRGLVSAGGGAGKLGAGSSPTGGAKRKPTGPAFGNVPGADGGVPTGPSGGRGDSGGGGSAATPTYDEQGVVLTGSAGRSASTPAPAGAPPTAPTPTAAPAPASTPAPTSTPASTARREAAGAQPPATIPTTPRSS